MWFAAAASGLILASTVFVHLTINSTFQQAVQEGRIVSYKGILDDEGFRAVVVGTYQAPVLLGTVIAAWLIRRRIGNGLSARVTATVCVAVLLILSIPSIDYVAGTVGSRGNIYKLYGWWFDPTVVVLISTYLVALLVSLIAAWRSSLRRVHCVAAA
jgi:hypothetical protein